MGGFEPDPLPTYRHVLEGIASTGFAGTELGDWGFMPDDAPTLGKDLASLGLAMIGAFTPVRLSDSDAHSESESVALRTACLLRGLCAVPSPNFGPFVILAEASTPARMAAAGRAGADLGLTPEQWRSLVAGAERIAVSVRHETGLPVVFHHHSGTAVESFDETAQFLAMTDPELVGLCYDTGHFAYPGADPLVALKRFGDRVWHVHFKDMREQIAETARAAEWDYHEAVANGLFCDLGGGDIDFPAILNQLISTDYTGWIVVEDEMPPGACDPLENAKHDRAYLRGLGL